MYKKYYHLVLSILVLCKTIIQNQHSDNNVPIPGVLCDITDFPHISVVPWCFIIVARSTLFAFSVLLCSFFAWAVQV